ncbi:hypothetical protein MATL_G00002480 [Megalops atlanticus]|uniref:Structure-specific endonuclease subunit SLX4 n=1 Tax=Megalops atlanticus TaxID=7932 RepID=A0A9D3QFQ1_MEGAT|nr:hypothetical protein MATL_G00002480 [Megalops atlanticus]
MDDSDPEFADLCSKLLKRVRKEPKKEESSQRLTQSPRPVPSQSKGLAKKRKLKNEAEPVARRQLDSPSCAQSNGGQNVRSVSQATLLSAKAPPAPASQPVGPGAPAASGPKENGTAGLEGSQSQNGVVRGLGVKEKVLRRMQQFKWVSPQKLARAEIAQPEGLSPYTDHATAPSSQNAGPPQGPQEDEALALRLQQEMDREAQVEAQVEAQPADLEDAGLFFCQLCQRDLSAMTAERRSQHINRCLDESEDSGPRPPAPPAVPECPICGKGFKSQKSRAAHLKRCSADMGVPPSVLLQALQRQAAETASDSASTTGQPPPAAGSKRRALSDPNRPPRKKQRKKAPPMDEDTMVALALSRSMEEQKEKERELEREALLTAPHTAPPAAPAPAADLRWRSDAGKRRGKKKKKKGDPPTPPPLLLVQDPSAALARLQDRVAALLFRARPPTPPTPAYRASSLPGWAGAAPLWQKSALRDGGASSVQEYYTPELSPLIEPWLSTAQEKQSVAAPVPAPLTPSVQPSRKDTDPGSVHPSPRVGSQTLCDLMDLAEEGMTLTQWGYTRGPTQDKEASVADLHLSGFVPESAESGAPTQSAPQQVALSRLTLDLSSMVNNPQLSDVQLQVDSGEVFFAHSFMLYARCPLLVQMVHDSGFGVQEEGMASAQRVLLGEVPPEAVHALLQFLYTAHCPLTPTLLPHVRELAVRLCLPELEQLCLSCPDGVAAESWVEFREQEQNEEENRGEQNFLELLHSMWEEGEEEEGGGGGEGGGAGVEGGGEGVGDGLALGDGDSGEEKVDEDELVEIYQFAATQRKMESGREAAEEIRDEEEEREEEEEGEGGSAGTEAEDEREEGVGREMGAEASQSQFSCVRTEELVTDTVRKEADTSLASHFRSNISSTHGRGVSSGQVADEGSDQAGGEPNGASQPSPGHKADTSLDRSYNRLFSETWGEYAEPSQQSARRSQPARAGGSRGGGLGVCSPLCGTGSRLQSSQSEVDVIDLSISPPLLPSAGLSPGEWGGGSFGIGGLRGGYSQRRRSPECSPLPGRDVKRESQVRRSGPDRPEPELIVLSDSGEECDGDAGSSAARRSPAPPPGGLPAPPPSGLPGPASLDSMGGSVAEADGSAEVSWLIPGTPPTRGASTQTHQSMRRTRLFPREGSAPGELRSSSSSSSLGDASAVSRPAGVPQSPSQVRGSAAGTAGFGRRPASGGVCSPSSALNHESDASDERSSEPSPIFTAPSSQPRRSRPPPLPSGKARGSLPNGTLSHGVPPPASSTPLPPQASRSSSALGEQERHLESPQSTVRSSSGESPCRRGQVSLCLSLSDSSPSLQKDVGAGGRVRGLPEQRRLSVESRHFRSPKGGTVSEREEREGEGSKGRTEEEERMEGRTEEEKEEEIMEGEEEEGAEEGQSFPQQSFGAMDPPMAFDDSWGLCEMEGLAPRFSLRLDSSAGVSPPKRGAGDTRGQDVHTPPAPPPPPPPSSPPHERSNPHTSLLDSKIWDDWEEEEEERVSLPLSQRVASTALTKRVKELKTPVASRKKGLLVPITPMPGFSDMDTPELKNQLNRFGVRPLPKRQMVLKLKEIHQYTHQLMTSESEDEGSAPRPSANPAPKPSSTSSSVSMVFKQPERPPAGVWSNDSPRKGAGHEEEGERLLASQGSTASSTAASEDSDRSNPELCHLSDDDDDSDSDGVTASQAVSRDAEKLQAVRCFIQSDPELYGRVLQYEPLVLSQLQARLRARGIRLGATKLLDFLDSQCITFTTAKPAKAGPARGRGRGRGRGGGDRRRRRGGAAKASD